MISVKPGATFKKRWLKVTKSELPNYDKLLAQDLVNAAEMLATGSKIDHLHALASVCGAGSSRYKLARDKYYVARAFLKDSVNLKTLDHVYVLQAAAQLLDPLVKLPDPEPQVSQAN